MIHSRLKLKEKTQWWIDYHFIYIHSSFARRLSSQREEKKISIKLIIQIHLFHDLIEFLNLKRINQMKQWNSSIEKLNSTQTTFIQNHQIEKNQLFSIEFILSQFVVFIIFINLKQKYDEIHWIDYFWIILVKKRNFHCWVFLMRKEQTIKQIKIFHF